LPTVLVAKLNQKNGNPKSELTRLAGEFVQGVELGQVTSTVDTKVGGGGAVLGLLEVVPPDVDVAVNQGAGNGLPVLAGVLGGGNGEVLVVAGGGPAGLGHVDGLAVGEGHGLVVARVEALVGVVDGVGQGGLPVGVAVEADPVNGVNDGRVGRVEEGVVGVDVADGDAGQGGVGDGAADLGDAVHQVGGAGADLVVGITVQILGTDGDTDDEVSEGSAVGGNGRLESSELVGDGGITSRDPETQKKGGLGSNGSRDGRNDAVGSTPLNCNRC
jgi:hypothetical protein